MRSSVQHLCIYVCVFVVVLLSKGCNLIVFIKTPLGERARCRPKNKVASYCATRHQLVWWANLCESARNLWAKICFGSCFQFLFSRWVSLFVCLFVCIRNFVCPSVYPSLSLSIHQSIYPSICPSVHQSNSHREPFTRLAEGLALQPTQAQFGPIDIASLRARCPEEQIGERR